MHIVDLSIKRPVTVLMGSLALVMFGLLAYVSLPVSLLPETAVPVVSIQTVYPGASPLTIETQLTKRIEDAVFSIGELDSITSYSMDSVSVVAVTFKDGKDENLALQEVKDRIDAIAAELPGSAEKPVISKVDITSGTPVMNIILEGDMPDTELYAYAQSTLRDQLAQVSGVGSVEISGGVEREILVELQRPPVAAAVFERFLPVEQIAALLARANMELPAGNIGIEGQDIPVRFRGEFDSLEAIEDIDVPTRAGVFKLRQLADVRDFHSAVRERTIFFDKTNNTRSDGALLLQIMKNPSANTIRVVDGVMKRIPRIEAESGVSLKVIREDAGFIRDSVNDTLSNLIMGIVLTALVLMVFLHDWRSTLIISLSMPFSIISTFLVMQALHISINVLSLMGLSCAVGTLVANSVVVLENIFRHKDRGLSRTEAASKGTKEVIMAVIASTLTNVAVFVPMGGMQGAMGQIISHFAYTVVISTVFSIIVSFTLTPLLASRLLSENQKKEGALSSALEKFFRKLETLYGASIAFLLKRRLRSGVCILAVFVLFVISIFGFTRVKMELVPKSDGGRIQVDVELPQGSGLEQTAALLANIEQRLAAYREVETILTNLGTAGSMERDVSLARMEIVLVPKTKRRQSNSEIAAAMVKTLSGIPGADIRVLAPSELVIAQGAPVDVYIRGADSVVLQQLGEDLRERMRTLPGIMHTTINSKAGKRELVFEPNRKQISQDGLSIQAVAVTLRAAVDGLVSTTYRESGGEEYDIRVKMAEENLQDIEDIRNIPVVTGAGVFPLSRYATVHFENGYNMIMRINKARTVELTAELLPDYTQSEVLAQVMSLAGEMELPSGYTIGQAGLSDSMGESMVSMGIVFITAILLVYMLLAAVLENVLQPLFILSTIPLSIIGVTAGCLLTGTVLNNIAMIGIVMLVGIVVNNAILLLDNYNQLKRGGMGVREALIASCPAKLKAILMSNIAIILGMIPMALGIGESLAEMRQPMGIIVTGGIVSSTIMTLWLIPCLEFTLTRRTNPSKIKGDQK
ncbi:multidrug ABC transporter [Spirochaetia bacterium]|nr:multidrug ABC transporter [Spirochaetia bacterium]